MCEQYGSVLQNPKEILMVNDKEWHEIGNKLAGFLGICDCQRKLKTIVDSLVVIYSKLERGEKEGFTGAELLIIAILDRHTDAITHGTNIECPILMKDSKFWKWLLEVKDNPNLEDN